MDSLSRTGTGEISKPYNDQKGSLSGEGIMDAQLPKTIAINIPTSRIIFLPTAADTASIPLDRERHKPEEGMANTTLPNVSKKEDQILLKLAQKAKGSTLSKVAGGLARFGAIAVGAPLYGATLAACGVISLAFIGTGAILGLGGVLVGGSLGALGMVVAGKKNNMFDGILTGSLAGGVLASSPLLLMEGISYIPRAIAFHTVGQLSAGMISFGLGEKTSLCFNKLNNALEVTSSPLYFLGKIVIDRLKK